MRESPSASGRARVFDGIGGRRFVFALGVLFVALAAGYPLLPGATDEALDVRAVLGLLVGGPGLVLAYGAYRLPRADVRPELYAAVGGWCLRGVVTGLAVTALIVLASDGTDVVPNGLLLTALGSFAGFAAGVYDARERTRRLELRETIEDLKASNERLERFVYAASHDLQEPLRMVSTYLQLIEARYADDLDEDGQEFLEFAVDGAERMHAMRESLTDYALVTTGGGPLEPTDAGTVLDDVRDGMRERIAGTDATITAEELPTVSADGEQLALVFRNLLDNAIEYSGDDPPRVHVAAEREGDAWRFSVRDEGVGIDPDLHDRIFEVFQRAHADERVPARDGGGIGLAVCERIVERHGGDIGVESTPGAGSTFTFTLPTYE